MPFSSEKQRRFMHAQHPEIAKRWEDEAKAAGVSPVSPSKKQARDYKEPKRTNRRGY